MYYELVESYTVTVDGDGATTYGVAVFKTKPRAVKVFSNKNLCLYKNSDITFCREEMRKYIELWNQLQPSLPQLKDLIEDIICGDETIFFLD